MRGEHPPDRVFIYLSPFIALWIGVTVTHIIGLIPDYKLRWVALLLLFTYVVVACQQERKAITGLMATYLKTEERTQDLRDNYYQHNFHPLKVAQYLEKNGGKEAIPVMIKWSEPHDMPEYLAAFSIPNYPADSLDYLLSSHKKVFLITLFPHELDSMFLATHHCSVKEVLPPSYHHLVEVSIQYP